jgi:hypothetical protein
VLIGPSLVLALIVGVFWSAFAVLVTGVAGARLPFVLILAILGAWAGDAVGGRLGIDLLLIGAFPLLASSGGAWPALGVVVPFSMLGPTRPVGPGNTRGGGR